MSESRGAKIIIAGSILLCLASFGLIARLVSARMKHRVLDLTDHLLIFAFVLDGGQVGMFIWGTQYAGWGMHADTVSSEQLTSFRKMYLAASVIEPAILFASKLSVLLLLRRIFPVRRFVWTANVLIAIIVCWFVSNEIASFTICRPFDSFWNTAVSQQCGNQHLLDIVTPVPWIVTDFAVLLAPVPLIWKLCMPIKQRVSLVSIFLIGVLACIISCVRYSQAFFSVSDETWDTIGLGIWQLAEANTTVLCACLLASRPFFMALMPDKPWSTMQSYFDRSRRRASMQKTMADSRAAEEGRSVVANRPWGTFLQDESQASWSEQTGPIPIPEPVQFDAASSRETIYIWFEGPRRTERSESMPGRGSI